jgi:5'-3' exonuclease
MSRIVLIDGGMLIWKTVPNKVLTETELMYSVNPEKTLQETYDLIDWYITEKIFKPVKPDYFIGFVDSSRANNFRTQVSESYKSNRIGKELPKYFKEAKEYLQSKWGFCMPEGIEVDDALLITENRLKNDYEIIIACQDKDILFTEGTRYNPVKDEWSTCSNYVEYIAFWKSMIVGDAADFIKGLPGKGEAYFLKLTRTYSTDNLQKLIFGEYLKHFGEYLGIEEFHKNYKLLKILREKEDFIIPEIQTINKQSVEQEIIPEF